MTIDELAAYGLERMDDEEVADFLATQSIGVLGLPADTAPYLLPLSYAYDGEQRLYFTYLLGENSRKGQLTERAELARFLVYSAETMFSWRSLLLEGPIESVPEAQWGSLEDVLNEAWRPELFRNASVARRVKLYRLDIAEKTGVKHTGLAPDLES